MEWLGHRLHLGQTATGTVLAAFGTALPEMVTGSRSMPVQSFRPGRIIANTVVASRVEHRLLRQCMQPLSQRRPTQQRSAHVERGPALASSLRRQNGFEQTPLRFAQVAAISYATLSADPDTHNRAASG
jgi:hypothetical protein